MGYPETVPPTRAVNDGNPPADVNLLSSAVTSIDSRLHTVELSSGSGLPAGAFVFVTGLVDNDSSAATANRTAIQAALTAAAAAGVLRGSIAPAGNNVEGGTRVILPVGRYYINRGSVDTGACLVIGNATTLEGHGVGTQLIMANSVASAASPCVGIRAAANSWGVTIRNMTLLGNSANQTDTNSASHGIDFNRSGSTELYDGMFSIENLFIYGCAGNGLNAYGFANTVFATGSRFDSCQGDGYYGKTDNHVSDCVAAQNGGYGFHWYAGTSIEIANLKSFGNTTGDYRIEYCKGVWGVNCQSEDFMGQSGWYMTENKYVTLLGCAVYRKATANATSNTSAFWIEDDGAGGIPNNYTIIATVTGDEGDSTTYPAYALTMRNPGQRMKINIQSGSTGTGLLRHLSGGTTTTMADVVINGQRGFSTALSLTAATVTIDCSDLSDKAYLRLATSATSNTTLTLSNAVVGQEITFDWVITSASQVYAFPTGAKWAGAAAPTKSTTAGRHDIVTFTYDGTNWLERNRSINIG